MTGERVALLVGAVIAVLLQIVIAPNIAIGFAVPNFLLAYVVTFAVASLRTGGLITAFVLGLIFDLVGAGPVGAMALLFVLVAFVLKRIVSRLDNGTLFVSVVLIVVSILLVEIVYGLLVLACGTAAGFFEAFVQRCLPDTLYTCVCALIIYPLVVRFIAQRSSGMPKTPLAG